MDDLVAMDTAAAALDLVLWVQRQLARLGREVALGLHVGILGERTHAPQDLTSTLSGARASRSVDELDRGREPVDHVQDVHLRKRLEVRLAALGMLVGAEPERLHGGHPKLAGTPDVLVEAVADENAVGGRDSERVERALEDRRMRLALAHLRREDGEIETLGEPHLLEIGRASV